MRERDCDNRTDDRSAILSVAFPCISLSDTDISG